MLTDLERQEIEQQLAHYPDRRAACVDALKIVQRHRRWVSDEDLKSVADLLEMTPDELDGVATFYNLIFRKPVEEAARHRLRPDDAGSTLYPSSHRLFRRVRSRARDDGG